MFLLLKLSVNNVNMKWYFSVFCLSCAVKGIAFCSLKLLNICFYSVHGSSVSLVSTASSLYSTPEEKQSHEIRKLRRELMDAQEKVHTLTNQLSTNVCLYICSANFP
jgi:neuron navigator 2